MNCSIGFTGFEVKMESNRIKFSIFWAALIPGMMTIPFLSSLSIILCLGQSREPKEKKKKLLTPAPPPPKFIYQYGDI